MKIDQLGRDLKAVEGRLAQYKYEIETNARQVMKQIQEVKKFTSASVENRDLYRFIDVLQSVEKTRDELLQWLSRLDDEGKDIANAVFKDEIVSSPTIDDIINAVIGELTKIDQVLSTDNTYENIVRAALNKTGRLTSILRDHLKADAASEIMTKVPILFEVIKTYFSDKYDKKLNISVKNLVIPAVVTLSCDSAQKYLQTVKTEIKGSKQAAANQINTTLSTIISVLADLYETDAQLCNQLSAAANDLDFSWQHVFEKHQKIKQNIEQKFTELKQNLRGDYKQLNYIASEVKQKVANLIEVRSEAHKKIVAQVEDKLIKHSRDNFKFLLLKKYYQKQKALYLAQGSHHQDRINSLERLSLDIDSVKGNNNAQRFVSFLDAIRAQKAATNISHKKIGFLGGFRSSRLEKMYSDVLEKSKLIDSMYCGEQEPDNLSDMQYNYLKNRIETEKREYCQTGKHHQDRMDSLKRLETLITELDARQGKHDRFAILYDALKTEAIRTNESQKVIGFFGNRRACRLQKRYDVLIKEGGYIQDILKASVEFSAEKPSSEIPECRCF
ncbi:MAG: hypothetical protein QM652_10240 [Legionella sp.]|uniref:hypothetical protein n=1 Tax=Legionella sp. TaxID=459 RepID=UPI0039E37127